jgi:hypothetical protein
MPTTSSAEDRSIRGNNMHQSALEYKLVELAAAAATGPDEALQRSDFARVWSDLAAKLDTDTQRATLRTLTAQLLDRGIAKIELVNYPSAVRDVIRVNFHRIQKAVDESPADYFDFNSYRFRSDLRITCFGRVPVGPEDLEIDGIPRSVLYRGNFSQALTFLRIVWQSGGVKPYYVIHYGYGADPATFLFSYGRKAQETMFRNLATCLAMNPSIRGVFATSWWHDPQLESVSPYLAYLRTGWTERGASLFRWGATEQDVRLATENSPHRRQAYQEGRYNPTSYMVVWPRQSLLRWAESN